MWKVCAIYGILSSVHYRGSDFISITATTNGRLTNQMRLIYSINQLDTYTKTVKSSCSGSGS